MFSAIRPKRTKNSSKNSSKTAPKMTTGQNGEDGSPRYRVAAQSPKTHGGLPFLPYLTKPNTPYYITIGRSRLLDFSLGRGVQVKIRRVRFARVPHHSSDWGPQLPPGPPPTARARVRKHSKIRGDENNPPHQNRTKEKYPTMKKQSRVS